MKIDLGLLVVFLLLGAVSSVIPVFGSLLVAIVASYKLLKKENFSGMFYSYLAFMMGTGLVTWFLWVSEESPSPVDGLFLLCIMVFVGFWSGFAMFHTKVSF